LESDRTDEMAETMYNVALSFLRLQADTETCDITVGQLRSLPEVTCKLVSEALVICSGHSGIYPSGFYFFMPLSLGIKFYPCLYISIYAPPIFDFRSITFKFPLSKLIVIYTQGRRP
jgi:hypothetical protein